MKKIVTVIAFALICSGAYAQFNQGRILVGGSIGFDSRTHKLDANNTTTTLGNRTTFTLSPQAGYFIIDNLAAGLSLSVSSESEKEDGSNNKTSTATTAVQPFVRYYLPQSIFFQAQVGFGGQTQKSKTQSTSTTTKYGLFSWAIGAGYAYFLTDNVAIEPLVYYAQESLKNKDTDAKLKMGGLGFQIGLQVYLGDRN